jgi:hypothetical protein
MFADNCCEREASVTDVLPAPRWISSESLRAAESRSPGCPTPENEF